jgi:hypothetical protein
MSDLPDTVLDKEAKKAFLVGTLIEGVQAFYLTNIAGSLASRIFKDQLPSTVQKPLDFINNSGLADPVKSTRFLTFASSPSILILGSVTAAAVMIHKYQSLLNVEKDIASELENISYAAREKNRAVSKKTTLEI